MRGCQADDPGLRRARGRSAPARRRECQLGDRCVSFDRFSFAVCGVRDRCAVSGIRSTTQRSRLSSCLLHAIGDQRWPLALLSSRSGRPAPGCDRRSGRTPSGEESPASVRERWEVRPPSERRFQRSGRRICARRHRRASPRRDQTEGRFCRPYEPSLLHSLVDRGYPESLIPAREEEDAGDRSERPQSSVLRAKPCSAAACRVQARHLLGLVSRARPLGLVRKRLASCTTVCHTNSADRAWRRRAVHENHANPGLAAEASRVVLDAPTRRIR